MTWNSEIYSENRNTQDIFWNMGHHLSLEIKLKHLPETSIKIFWWAPLLAEKKWVCFFFSWLKNLYGSDIGQSWSLQVWNLNDACFNTQHNFILGCFHAQKKRARAQCILKLWLRKYICVFTNFHCILLRSNWTTWKCLFFFWHLHHNDNMMIIMTLVSRSRNDLKDDLSIFWGSKIPWSSFWPDYHRQ